MYAFEPHKSGKLENVTNEMRYRPGVFISVGQPNGFILSPDVEIKASRPDEAAGELTEALTKRAMACVS